MSEQRERVGIQPSGAETVIPYEAPKLVVLGNARDLLAGGSGSLDDAACSITEATRAASQPCP